jgi:enoyl-[acyl-carrier protein] reductase II
MGCQGVWMGTRFIASKEAHAGQAYKEAIVEMSESDTTISRGFTGKTLRALKNETTDKFEKEPAKPFPAQVMESAQMNRLGPIAGITENLDRSFQCFAVGQGGGGVREVLTCADIVANTVAEAEATLKRIGKLAA